MGCGDDTIQAGIVRFDKSEGANHLSRHLSCLYDFVFASHVLEHMHDPATVLRDRLSVIKPSGHLIAGLDADVLSVELQDHGYDRHWLRHAPGRWRLRLPTLWRGLARHLPARRMQHALAWLFITLGAPVDQTALPGGRLAQIQIILTRRTAPA